MPLAHEINMQASDNTSWIDRPSLPSLIFANGYPAYPFHELLRHYSGNAIVIQPRLLWRMTVKSLFSQYWNSFLAPHCGNDSRQRMAAASSCFDFGRFCSGVSQTGRWRIRNLGVHNARSMRGSELYLRWHAWECVFAFQTITPFLTMHISWKFLLFWDEKSDSICLSSVLTTTGVLQSYVRWTPTENPAIG